VTYLFDPEQLQRMAQLGIGHPPKEAARLVIDQLSLAYPRHIERRQDWLFSLSAGAVGVMTPLHCSLSEYLIIFGTPVGTEAFSGRYHIDIYDFLMGGEMWTYTEDCCSERVITRPGEMALLERGRVKGFRLLEGTWLLEYGRGPVPTAIPMALGDAVFSGMDPKIVAKTFWHYGRLVLKELLQGKI
jgi:hypothetical protein